MKIEIGGGTQFNEGYENLDPVHGIGNFKRHIQSGIPVPDNSVDMVRASHVLEHIPAGHERISAFNEVWRVLKSGGTFYVIVPMATGTWHAFADPTHVSFWVPQSFHYFDGRIKPNADYGIRPWQMLDEDLRDGWEGYWTATPIKETT